jgi:hypothetical protein
MTANMTEGRFFDETRPTIETRKSTHTRALRADFRYSSRSQEGFATEGSGVRVICVAGEGVGWRGSRSQLKGVSCRLSWVVC